MGGQIRFRPRTLLVGVAPLMVVMGAGAGAVATEYDPRVPTPAEVLGYPLGSRVTDYHGMESYLSALAGASPRVDFGSYGHDDEHRELRFVVVSSEANLARIEEIKESTARLTDPRSLPAGEAARLVAETPVTIWLNYSTDGNETAGLESALMMAHHLAAAEGEATRRLRDEAVIVITPIMNPSSHERWTSWSNSFAAGPAGNADPLAMEHNPPWGVLTNNNHFLVDLNRESIWAIQSESAALRDLYYQWNPAVFVDHHGEYDDFTGPGYEEPLNPLITAAQRRWLDRFGRAIGTRFGARGWAYSPWETGSFYPGFWESFGSLNGAVGFTYETMGGGSRGLRFERPDGSIATLEDAARQHFEASLAVIETAVAARAELVGDFSEYWRSASGVAAAAPERGFIVDPRRDPELAAEMLSVLTANGVEVYRAPGALEARQVHDYFGGHWEAKSLPAGSYWIPVDQPRVRLLLTMMRKDFRLPEVTVAAAETFRTNSEKAGFENPKIARTTYLFYDVTAWSLPLTYGVPTYWVGERPKSAVERVDSPGAPPAPPPVEEARYGYLFSGDGIAATRMLVDLLQQDLVVNVAYDGLTIAGREFPRGSVLVRRDRNPDVDLPAVLSAAAARHGVLVTPVDETYSQSGPSLGSDRLVYVKRPSIAVLVGEAVSIRSFGDLWFTLERLYGLEFTALYRAQLDGAALDRYDVLVLPDGWYEHDYFSEELLAELDGWISRGGTLVCLRHASEWAADPEVGVSEARLRPAQWPPEESESEGGEARTTLEVPGAILKAVPDPHHFLTFGYGGDTAVLVFSNLAFEPSAEMAAPFALAPNSDLKLGGFAYPDSLARLAGTPYVVDEQRGEGRVVLFLDDPNFRVYWRGLARLFMNAVLLGPSL